MVISLRSSLAAVLLWPAIGFSQEVQPTETVVKLAVEARGQPTPALKYQLLPDFKELNPGNPVQAYLACFSEQNLFFYSKEAADEREKWAEMPLNELPAHLADYGGIALKRANEAARLDTPDWQILLKLRRDGLMFLVPEVQQMRTLAWAVSLRMRGQVKARRFDDAVASAKTLLAMARHLDEHPTLIAGLVGNALCSMTVPVLEEFVQQQGSPNLFWAYVNLPRPFMTFRKGWQSERVMLTNDFEPLIHAHRPMTETEIADVYVRIKHTIKSAFVDQGFEVNPVDPAALLIERTKKEGYMTAAKQRLRDCGIKEAVLSKMPAEQIAMLDGLLRIDMVRDESLKWFNLPYHQAEAGLVEAEAKTRALAKNEQLPEINFALGMPIFSLRRIAETRARLEARFALLAHVEALRLHAATHAGRWPAALKDMNLPLPVDPYTGEPFQYRVEGNIAHLRPTLPKALLNNSGANVRFEVVLRK